MGDKNLTIVSQTFEDHQQLINLIEKLGEALKGLPTNIEWGESQWFPDVRILDFIQIQALSLHHAKQSTAQGFYRDAYHLIRMPFEAYFLLRLISTCDKYPVRMKITRGKSDSSLVDVKRRAIQNAKKTFGNRLTEIYEEGNNILIAIVRGVPVFDDRGNDTGIVLPFYYGAWQQYRPIQHHLKGKSPQRKLATSRFLQSDWGVAPKSSKTQVDETHSQLYRWFLTFDKVLQNLRLNGVLNLKTTTRVLVHYNFLSNFSHSTSDTIGGSRTFYNYYDSKLALLYICHLLSMYLELAMNYLTKWRHIQVKNPELYRGISQEVEEAFGYFWFIFNKPHQYDRFAHANRKCNYKKKLFYRPEDIRLGDVRYYENPLYRLKQMHQSQRELTSRNVYDSPFPRDDALR